MLDEEEEGKYSKTYMLEEMYKQLEKMQLDPALGRVPRERLVKAWQYTKNLQQAQKAGKATSKISGLNWVNRGPTNVGGRTRTIMISPNDVTGNTGFAGSVGGGLWRCNNLKSNTPIWEPVNDFLQTLAISSIAYNPANTNIFYAGTGEGFNNSDAAGGMGIIISTDGGNTWNFLPSTQTPDFYYVNKVVVNNLGHVYAATRNGIFRSFNGGSSWEEVLNGNFGDIEVNSAGVLYASGMSGTSGLYRSTSGDAETWTNLCTAGIGLPQSGIERIETAIAPNDPNTIYTLFYQIFGTTIYRTDDNAVSFIKVSNPNDLDAGILNYDFTRGQGWYDLILKVDPNNSRVVYTGGIDAFKSADGGENWTQLTHWYGGYGVQYMHADQHGIEFEGNNSNVIYFTNDGGIAQTSNGTAAVPAIVTRNTNYIATQFYSCAGNPEKGSNDFLAGAQDNGTQKFYQPGLASTVSASGGDGAYCNIDENDAAYQYTQYVYNNYYRSTDEGFSFFGVDVPSDISGTGWFINPSTFDEKTNTLFAATSAGQYLRWIDAHFSDSFGLVDVTGMHGQVTALYVSEVNADRIYLGTDAGEVLEISDASNGASPIAGRKLGNPAYGYLNCIWEDPLNANHLMAVYSGYGQNNIWETINADNAEPTWVKKDGNLPDMPVYWVLPAPGSNMDVLVATELGVFSTTDFTNDNPNWEPTVDGMANVRVTQLRLRKSDNLIVASTYGRGLFTSDFYMQPAAYFSASSKVSYTEKSISFTDASVKATLWQWDFNGDGKWDSNEQNPEYAYTAPGVFTVKLRINNNPSLEETYTITILPNKGTPYATSDGGNFEVNINDFGVDNIGISEFSRGNSTQPGKDGTHSGNNAYVIDIKDSQYSSNSTAWLYTPSFNCTKTGNYIISFYAKYDVENTWDGFRVEYSLDKGNTWLLLGNVVQSNWYDYSNPEGNRPFPQGESYFSNEDKPDYTLCTYTTNVFQNNEFVAFRIVFKSDQAEVAAGLALDDFTLEGPQNSLPVTLISFTGYANGANNFLNWKTASEINSNRYEIERSIDGKNYGKTGTVLSANNATGASYAFSENVKLINAANFYYQLKMIDNDGRYTYSNVLQLTREIIKDKISLLGNPAHSSVKLLIPSSSLQQPLQAQIIAVNGALMQTINLTATTSTIDVSRLSAATYFMKFIQNNRVIQTNKFVKE